jgi:hypothetical protein
MDVRHARSLPMLTAVILVVVAVAAWVLVDRLLLQRDERLHRGHAAWSESGPNKTFHSTGWEETVPPLEASDLRIEPRVGQQRRRSEDRAAA